MCPSAHAPYGADANLPEAQYQPADEGTQDYPYLLRSLRVDRPNQVRCVDITYLPLHRGARHGLGPVAAHASLYLVAITDWHARIDRAWWISNTLDADFCVEVIYRFGLLDIMNSDQGSHFTSFAWTDRLRRSRIRISMDGKDCHLNNIFIERLWRTLKYECVYLHAWETGSQASAGVRTWMQFYNHCRPHKAFGGRPPAVVYFNTIETDQQAQVVA